MNWFSNERTGDVHFHTNSFAQRLVFPQRQKSTIHPWAAHWAFDYFSQRISLRLSFKVKREFLKCLYSQQDFCGFGISITSRNVFKPKNLNSNAFLPWNQALNFPLWPRPMKLATWWKIGAEWRHFRKISKRNAFILLFWRTHRFTNFSLIAFCQRERLTTTKTTVSWVSKIWQFLTWRHDPFQNPYSYFALTHGQLN